MPAGPRSDREGLPPRSIERRSESLLAGPASADPSARAALAACRSRLGWLLWTTGNSDDALAAYRLARADQEALAAAPEASNEARRDQAHTINRIATVPFKTGKPADAEAKYRKAVAIRRKLGDDNPSDMDLRGALSYDYLRVAALQAWFGQDKELSSTCEKLLSLAKDTEDPLLVEKAAKCCSLRQADPKLRETALVLARRAVEHGKGTLWLAYCEMVRGMAGYRCGHFAEADAALNAAMNDPGKIDAESSTSAFYRAMGLLRQGNTDLARKLATEAAAKMKPLPVDEQKPLAGGADCDETQHNAVATRTMATIATVLLILVAGKRITSPPMAKVPRPTRGLSAPSCRGRKPWLCHPSAQRFCSLGSLSAYCLG